MHSADGRYTIVFNGEIYNYRDLRRQLALEGAVFQNSSDTEVILAAYARWGHNCLEHLTGMFAFALWDNIERSLWLVRDRIGKKPLYFIAGPNSFIFASEAKALWEFASQIDARAIDQYLTYRYIPGDRTFYREIKKLPAAHWILVDATGQIRKRQSWWAVPPVREGGSFLTSARMSQYEEEFQALFADAVRSRMIADVPVGIFLSNGIDSVSTAKEMAKHSHLRAFTMGFHSETDEIPAARALTNQLGGIHSAIYLEAQDFEDLPQAFAAMDEPYGDPIVLPTYLLARAAQKSVKVVLTGDGADELLGGYIHHQFFKSIPETLPRFCYQMGSLMAKGLPLYLLEQGFDYPVKMGQEGQNRLADLLNIYPQGAESYLAFASLFTDSEKAQLYTPDWNDHLKQDPDELIPEFHRHFNRKDLTLFDKVLQWDFRTWFPEQTLMKLDRLTMAHGLEGRCPYADHRLVEFFFRLPLAAFRKMSHNKAIIRKLYSQDRSGRKHAFCLPVNKSYREAFNRIQERLLNKETIDQGGMIRQSALGELLEKRKNSPLLTDKKITTLMALSNWMNYAKR